MATPYIGEATDMAHNLAELVRSLPSNSECTNSSRTEPSDSPTFSIVCNTVAFLNFRNYVVLIPEITIYKRQYRDNSVFIGSKPNNRGILVKIGNHLFLLKMKFLREVVFFLKIG